ncbi:M1-specific T cell receptor beta chain-like [Nerophis lumbriciformis]|uniref:M1-specific T cell receptor beta chain-like n=1 Tax=Nerophis lumbriciformis TaxID=546530 RepID=UPI002AE02ED7|nr:M1-specific T cell receptor beta chain-like [Nerophis lumbriciformis]
MRAGLVLVLVLVLLTRLVGTVRFQPPAPKVVTKESRVDFHCSHDDDKQDVMLWYHQGRGRRPITVVGSSYVGNKPQHGRRFNITREATQRGVLSIHRVAASDAEQSSRTWTRQFKGQKEMTQNSLDDHLKTNWHGSCGCKGVKRGFRVRRSHCGSRATAASEVHFDAGTKLIVLEPGQGVTPPAVTLLPPSPEEDSDHRNKEKRTKTLVCVVTGFFPDHVAVLWQIDGGVVASGVATDAEALRDHAHYGTSSRLSVDVDTWFTPGRAFTCTVTFFDGNRTSSHSDTVYGTEDMMTREDYLRMCHSAKMSYMVLLVKSNIYTLLLFFLLWKRQGERRRSLMH